MRRAFALLLSFSLGTSSLFAYDDYSDPNRNYGSGSSVNQFQNSWMNNNNWSNSFSDSIVINRPAVQFPSNNFDLSFSNNFSSFNSNSFNSGNSFNSYSKLDLNFNSFSTPAFTPQPVTQNFNFQANDFSSFTPSNANTSFDAGRLSAQPFKQDTFSSNQNLWSQDLKLSDDFSHSRSDDFNSMRNIQEAQPHQPASEILQTFVTAPAKLATMAPEAVSIVRDSFNKLFSVPQTDKTFSTSLKTDPAMSQVRQPGLFEGVAAVVKAIPALFAAVGNGIKNAAVAVWDRVVLGHRTENTVSMPDGSTLTGKITLNRKDEVVSIGQGTVRTVGQMQKTEDGQSVLMPASKAVSINGEDYLKGDFVYDGQKFNLSGPGLKLTTQAGETIEGTQKVKQYVQGDGKGGETPLGYGPMSTNDTFRETTTGLSFRGSNGVWKLDPGQSGNLKLDGKTIAIKIDDGGHLADPVKAPVTGQKAQITLVTGVLPNPETSGFQVMAVAKLDDKGTFKTGIPGAKPSQYLPDQINDWRQKTSALVRSSGFMSNSETEAKVHQEGDQYVFTGGHVAFVAVTGPDSKEGSTVVDGQKTLSTEAVLSGGSHLTVTGPTDFPSYETKIITGKVDIIGDGKMSLHEGSLYVNQDQGVRLAVMMGGKQTAVPVKSLDLKEGTFVAVIPDVQEGGGEYVKTSGREVKGKINFEDGRATLLDTSIKEPLYGPSTFAGINQPDEVKGTAWITVRSNALTVQLDRSGIGLDDYRNPAPRAIPERPVFQCYRIGVQMYQDQGNPGWARGIAYVATSIASAGVMAEDTVNFTKEAAGSFQDMRHYAGLALFDLIENKSAGDACLNTLCTIEVGAETTLRILPVIEMAPQIGKVVVSEVSGLTQSARQVAGQISSQIAEFSEPVMNQSGRVLVETTLPKTSFNPLNPGPLSEDIVQTFRSGTYTQEILSEPKTLYRVIGPDGNPAGNFWTTVKPRGAVQSIVDSALRPEWGNNATRVITARIPPGTTIYEGLAGPQGGLVGGGPQVYVSKVDPRWIINE